MRLPQSRWPLRRLLRLAQAVAAAGAGLRLPTSPLLPPQAGKVVLMATQGMRLAAQHLR